ncbi:MAG: SDR family oxidoreductase [Bacteroidota bacterium]|nr:SDR family oxidoreductase [Bacteroidota bacterium]
MKILITGSNGLMGQKLVSNLIKKSDVDFLATSLHKNKMKSNFPFDLMDVRDKVFIDNIFNSFRPDVVIHTAAMTDVGPCETRQSDCWELNVISTQNIIDACNRYKSRLIYISTDFVFDGEAGPYSENDKPNPVSFYGKSKYEAEKLVMQNAKDWAIVRTILVYGICSDMARSNIILWVKKNLETGKAIRVVNDQFRMPTLAEDLAEGTIQIALRGASGIYHLSGKDYLSIYEIALKTANFFNLDKNLISPISSAELNETGKRPPSTGFVLDKAIHDLDYRPRSIEEGLEVMKGQM